MNSKKVFFFMVGLISVLGLMVFISLFVGSNLIKKQSERLVSLKLENKLLDEQQAALTQANKDIAKYSELESIAKQIVPQDKDQARTVREIIQIAEQNNIKIKSVTFTASNLGNKTPTSQNSGEDNKNQSSSQQVPVISQAKPVEGINGVYSVQMDIAPDDSSKYSYYQLINFMTDLENNRRTSQITRVKIDPDTTTGAVGFTLTISTFIKP